MRDLTSTTTLLAAIGCGLMAGVFFAFSTFVMKALARLPAKEGIAAMQSINVAAVPSWFLAAFLTTSLLCLAVIVLSLKKWGESSGTLCLSGAIIYLLGNFLVTMLFNVPLNNALASLSPESAESTARWMDYLTRWTMWNHVRTVSGLAATILFLLGR